MVSVQVIEGYGQTETVATGTITMISDLTAGVFMCAFVFSFSFFFFLLACTNFKSKLLINVKD